MDNVQGTTAERGEIRSKPDDSQQAALLIDFDNVTLGIRSNLGQELRNLLNSEVISSNVAVQRAYADWRRSPQYIVPLSEASIDLIFAPAYGSSKKNATDIRLAIDALELVFTRPEIKTFILMSGDSDFSSLVLKLKEYGKYVIGVGIQESSSDLLVQNCDEYYSYSTLAGLTKAGEETRERHDPWVLAEKSIQKMVQRSDTMRSDRLKQVMIEIDPSFNEKEQGFNKFNRFVVEAASRGLLSIKKMENGQYAVAPGDKVSTESESRTERAKGEAPVKPGRKAEGRKTSARRGRGRSKEREPEERAEKPSAAVRGRPKLTRERAFEVLDKALEALLERRPDDSVRDSDVKRRILKIDADFDEGELGFSKFSKFLLDAEEAGAIELTRSPNGNLLVSRPSRSPRRKRQGQKRQEPARKRPREEAAPEKAAESRSESTMKRLSRFFFGSDTAVEEEAAPTPEKGRGRDSEAARERKPSTPSRPTGQGGRPSRPRDREQRDSVSTRGRGEGDRRSREAPREAPKKPDRGGHRSSRGSRESEQGERRERKEEAPRTEAAAVVESAPETPPPKASAPAEKTEEPRKKEALPSAPLPGSPRGTIRGRWGKRGKYRPSEARPPVLEGQTGSGKRGSTEAEKDSRSGGTISPAASGTTKRASEGELVSDLKRRYAGVGEKTAATLVEAFGADVYRVLEQEPERVREVLPASRANRIIEARHEEVKTGGE